MMNNIDNMTDDELYALAGSNYMIYLKQTNMNRIPERSYINHEDAIGKLRVSMMREVEAMLQPIGKLDCEGSGVGITTVLNGNLDVKTIYYNYAGKQVEVKDNLGECHDYSELDTDDMNAIYEHVYYRMFEKTEA